MYADSEFAHTVFGSLVYEEYTDARWENIEN